MAHVALPYDDKIFMFAGCFMYNRKRQIRESVSSVSVFDPAVNPATLKKVKANSAFLINPRKNHAAFIFGKTLVNSFTV